jgi:hypothetical protein
MKRFILLTCLLICVALFATVTALMRDRLRPQFNSQDSPQSAQALDALPQKHLNQNRLHKLIIKSDDSQDTAVYGELAQRNAIRNEFDYGSFKLVVVDEDAVGGRAALQAMQITPGDENDMIWLNGYLIDTSAAQMLSKELPKDLEQSRMTEARRGGYNPGRGLYIVQFVGPTQDAWLKELESTGAKVVTYVSNNAYVVYGDARSAALISRMDEPFVQWMGDYQPAYKLTPAMTAARTMGDAASLKVTVQLLNNAEGNQQAYNLRAYSRQFIGESRVLNYRNITAVIQASQLTGLAESDGVFAIEERKEIERLDEAQGQILAGNLSGNSPTGPGYLSFLASKGFNSSQFGSFVVEVADDATSITGHPDLPSGRVVFQNNPTNQTGVQGGHGFLNTNIIGGFNTGTGSAFEDSLGFNYGLGIAPFARMGSTAIFGPSNFSSTAWENTAYGQGARISSNSWGFTGAAAQRYDTNAQEYDRIVRDAQSGVAGNQQLIVVFAAGNAGSGAGTVSSPATAKNVITVGASENVRQTGTDGCGIANTGADSANDIISFSSRGPVNSAGGDGRIKPDIVAPGTHIEAGIPQSNYDGTSVCDQFFPAGQTLYGWSSGTSHSTPAVAGGAALVYQFFINSGLSVPSPAMTKAFLMNSAAYMSGVGAGGNLPSNSQGMGRMDLGRAFDGAPRLVVDQTTTLGATGQTFQVTGSVATTSQPFRVTLAWSDAPGPTTGVPNVNNLDLEVTINGQTTFLGNVFSGANSTMGGTADSRNNVESVFLPAGTSGNFTITVRATNIAGDGVPGNADTTDQDFALVVYNGTSAPPTQPTIGVTPTSLSFTATAGGSNPANQTINITNTGGGTLNWTASDDAPWLTVSPASGTAPSTLTASVNISGLAAGTFNGTITISATGATNTPVNVPVTLTVNGAGGAELIVNGGFEGSAAPWTLSGAQRSTGSFPHSGTGYLILGAANNANHTAFQQITIPSGTSPSLTYFLNITSNETTTTTVFDRLFVEVRSTSGTLLATLATFSNLNKGTAGAYVLRGPNGLGSFAGQTVRIQFRATTDASLTTTFRVDDVSVK